MRLPNSVVRFPSVLFAAVLVASGSFALATEPTEPVNAERPVKNGFSELHFAAMRGDATAVAKLLKAGADVNTPQQEFRGTPLQYAAAAGHVEVVRVLIKHDAKIDAVDANGRTPLIWAAMQGQTEAAKLLLDATANIGSANDGGWTPLHYAMSYGHKETADLLLKRGASTELLNRQGQTPLDVKDSNVKKDEDKQPTEDREPE